MGDTSEDESSSEDEHPVVNRDWLQQVLAKHFGHDLAVDSYTIKPGCQQTESILSDIAAIQVQYKTGDQQQHSLNLIVKLLPPDPFSRYFVAEAQFDLREIKFYTQIAPDLEAFEKDFNQQDRRIKLPIPKCYYAQHVPVEGSEGFSTPTSPGGLDESVILLQDLKHAGFYSVDFVTGLSVIEAEAALEAIARFHALSLGLKIKLKLNLNEKYHFLFQTERASNSYQQLVERGLPALLRFLEAREDMKQIQARIAAITPVTKDLMTSLLTPDEPLSLITHTDFWANNLLFRGNECVILDWQMVTCSRPTNDVALLIISSLPTEHRRQSTRHLLDKYWTHFYTYCNQLGIHLEDDLGYSRARLAEDYRRSQLLALLLCVGSVDVAFGNPVTEQRILDVLTDLDKDGVLCADIVPKAQLTV